MIIVCVVARGYCHPRSQQQYTGCVPYLILVPNYRTIWRWIWIVHYMDSYEFKSILLIYLGNAPTSIENEPALLTQGRVAHICVSDSAIISLDNSVSPIRHQTSIWTNASLLSFDHGQQLRGNSNQHSIIFVKEYAGNVACKVAAILSRP